MLNQQQQQQPQAQAQAKDQDQAKPPNGSRQDPKQQQLPLRVNLLDIHQVIDCFNMSVPTIECLIQYLLQKKNIERFELN